MVHPFSLEVSKLIADVSHATIQVGVTIIIAAGYFKWLSKRGFDIPAKGKYTGGASEYLLMGAIIFAIAQVFKRGVEIQSENEVVI